MNFIIPIGDFIRKGGDVMLGDLVLEDARLFVIRDQTSFDDPNIVMRAKTVGSVGLSFEYQNQLGVGISQIASILSGGMFISPASGEPVLIPATNYGAGVELTHTIEDKIAEAPTWWIIYSLMFR